MTIAWPLIGAAIATVAFCCTTCRVLGHDWDYLRLVCRRCIRTAERVERER